MLAFASHRVGNVTKPVVPGSMVMVMMGAVSVWWSLSTLEEAKSIVMSSPDHSGPPPTMGISALESKLGAQPLTPPAPPKVPAPNAAPVTPTAQPDPKK